MIGHRCHEFWADPDKPCDGCPTAKAFKTKKSEHTTTVTPDGRIWDEKGEPVFDAHGRVIGVVEIANDITEPKRAEEELREREAYLRAILNNAPFLMWLKDREGRFLAVNDVFAKSCGQQFPAAVIGKTDLDVWPVDLAEGYRADDREVMNQKLQKHVEERVLVRGDTKWFETFKTPILDEDGNVMGTTGFARDITERKQAEEALLTSEAQLSNAVVMAHLGHWEYDVATDLFTFNDHFYKIFRTTAEQVGGYTMSSADYARRFVHPDDISVVVDETRKAIETSDPFFSRQLEHRMLYADGEIGYITVRFFIVKDNTGQTIKTYGVNQDITERKRVEEAL